MEERPAQQRANGSSLGKIWWGRAPSLVFCFAIWSFSGLGKAVFSSGFYVFVFPDLGLGCCCIIVVIFVF